MLSKFKEDTEVGMMGGVVENMLNNTLLNAGLDFAYGPQDSVIPFARFITSSNRLHERNPPVENLYHLFLYLKI